MKPPREFAEAVNVSKGPHIVTVQGIDNIVLSLVERRRKKSARPNVVAVDGFAGVDWERLRKELEESARRNSLSVKIYDFDSCRRADKSIDSLIERYLDNDKVFGKVFRRSIDSFFSKESIISLRAHIMLDRESKQDDLIIVIGWGCALRDMRNEYDCVVYFDLTREEALKRFKKAGATFGTQSIGPKRLYYVDFPVSEKHRNELLETLNLYVDANCEDSPIMLATEDLRRIVLEIASKPFRLKPIYEPGPWGGQWLKKVRHLPQDWPNCAWSYEVIAPEMSLLIKNYETMLELPWKLFFHLTHESVMGTSDRKLFGGEFPIRFDYLDTMDGGDLSIQVHPPTDYIRRNFNERYHQGEMYYVVDCKPGKRVNLGLQEGASLDEFKKAAEMAEREGIPFDYTKFVNGVAVQKHDILMIPPGTVHGSGEGLVVLEISSTTYRYTFKIYDHLRPDLSGVMRPIHIHHAFRVIKQHRRSAWVEKNLVPKPILKTCGKGWREFLIASGKSFFHQVFRVEIETEASFELEGRFHILTLVEGESVKLISNGNEFVLNYSETVIVPASTGCYTMRAGGKGKCMVVKALLK